MYFSLVHKQITYRWFSLADIDQSHFRGTARSVHEARSSLAQAAIRTVSSMKEENSVYVVVFQFLHSKYLGGSIYSLHTLYSVC